MSVDLAHRTCGAVGSAPGTTGRFVAVATRRGTPPAPVPDRLAAAIDATGEGAGRPFAYGAGFHNRERFTTQVAWWAIAATLIEAQGTP